MFRLDPRLVVACAVAAAVAPAATAREVWVLNETSDDISILDAASEKVIATIPLPPGPGAAVPRGLAFSTRAAAPGAHVFVTRGPEILVLDVATRSVARIVDVAALLGRAATLRGCAAARPRARAAPPGGTRVTSYLHVAADVEDPDTLRREPWFVVLDQDTLVIPSPPASELVSGGPLFASAPPPGVTREALDVAVLPTPAGPDVERAWYTVRERPATSESPEALAAVPVAGLAKTGPAFHAGEPVVATLGVRAAPDACRPGAPFGRELPVLPLGPDGRLRNLDTGGACDPGGILVAAAVAGPGPASYTVFAADRAGARVFEIDPASCQAVEHGVADGPVALGLLGQAVWRKTFVAAHDADAVSVLRADGSTGTVSLGPGGGPCQRCPVGIAVQETVETICQAEELTVERVPEGNNLTWQLGPGCPPDARFDVWCACVIPNDPNCPCREDLPPPPAPRAARADRPLQGEAPNDGNGWIRIGSQLQSPFLHATDYGGSLLYDVEPSGG